MVVVVSSARWLVSVAGMVESEIGEAGSSMRVADVGRVVDVQLNYCCR